MQFARKKDWAAVTILFLYCVVSYRFFNYVGIPSAIPKFLQSLLSASLLVYCGRDIFSTRHSDALSRTMRWIVWSLILSIFSAWLFWRQSIPYGFFATSEMLVYASFFLFVKTKPTVRQLELVVLVLGVTYAVLWIYAFSQLPTPVFSKLGDETEYLDEGRGMLRVNFVGRLSLIFAYFICVNKFFVTKRKWFIVLAAFLFVILVCQLTRQLIVWPVLVTLIYLFKKFKKTTIVLGAVAVTLFLFVDRIRFSDNTLIGSLVNLSIKQAENNSKAGDEDIRITEYKYFFGEWSKNFVTDIVGNGYPGGKGSDYLRFYGNLQERKKLYLSDVGYAQMFVVQGAVGVFLYLLLYWLCVRRKMPPELEYVRMFVLFLIPANIAASWYAGTDGVFCTCICVYLSRIYGKVPHAKELKLLG